MTVVFWIYELYVRIMLDRGWMGGGADCMQRWTIVIF